MKELQCCWPLAALLTCTDQCTVADDISIYPHTWAIEKMQGLLPLSSNKMVSCFNSNRLDLKMKIQRNWLCATNLNKIEPLGLYFSSIPIISAGKSTKTVRFKGPWSFEDINLESRRIYTIHTSPFLGCLPRFPKKSCFLTGCDGSTEANTISLDLQRQLFLGGKLAATIWQGLQRIINVS